MNTLGWLVRREYWEHRGSLLRAPLIAMAVFIGLALIALPLGHGHFHQLTPIVRGHAVNGLGDLLSGAVLITTLIMSINMFFYAAGSLYDDRRDRSALFWKSLPVSDLQTVLSKICIPLFVAPVLAVIIGVAGGTVMACLVLIVLSFSQGIPPNVFSVGPGNLLHLAGNLGWLWGIYVLSALPTIGWLMACSAWARTKPLLWAVLLPLGAWMAWGWVGLMGWDLPSLLPLVRDLLCGLWPTIASMDHDSSLMSSIARSDLWWGAFLGVGLLGLAVVGRRRSVDT